MKPVRERTLSCIAIACAALAGGPSFARPLDEAAAVFTVKTTPALRAQGGYLQAVSALSTADAWSVGTTIAHFNGTTWSAVAAVAGGGTLADVSALTANDVWAAGMLASAPLVEHWNGKSWTQVQTPSLNDLSAAFNSTLALSTANVWAAGETVLSNEIKPLFERWNGKAWKVVTSPTTAGFIEKIAGTGSGDIWAVGYTTSAVAQPLIEHFDGKQWRVVSAPTGGVGGQLWGVTALSPTNAWAVGSVTLAAVGNPLKDAASPVQTLVEHWDGQSWQIVSTPNIGSASVSQRNVLYGIAALSPTDIWAAGQFQLPDGSGSQLTLGLHWDGTAWTIAPTPDVGTATALHGVGVAQPSTVFLVGIAEFGGGLPDQSPLIAATSGG